MPIDGLCIPIALVTMFIEQTYAGGAGRGYGAGPTGQPGAFTLLDPGSVRMAAWANTLALDVVREQYAADGERPWSNEKRAARARAATGLVEGLFFQPRGIWLIPAGEGICSFTGIRGPLVRRSPFLPKSELAKRVPGREDLWQHPCAPLALNSSGIGAIRLNPERPVWTSLARLLQPSAKNARVQHPCEGPAPVLRQWQTLQIQKPAMRLLVLDFDRDKANVKGRFCEAFPLGSHLLSHMAMIDTLRAVSDDVQFVARLLLAMLSRAQDPRKHAGLAVEDAHSAFWVESERPFFDWLTIAISLDPHLDASQACLQAATERVHSRVRQLALDVFDRHVRASEFEPRKLEFVARARRQLMYALYPAVEPQVADPSEQPHEGVL